MVDRRKTAQKLVNAWARSDRSIVRVLAFHLLAQEQDQPAEFLILSGSSPHTDRVEPFGFRATLDVPFPTRIAEVAADEFEQRKAEKGFLPQGWSLADAEELRPQL